MKNRRNGFTIVELLIVIVIIAILATIVVVMFQGIRARSVIAKRDADLTQYSKALIAARAATGKTLTQITGQGWTERGCSNVPPYGGNQANVEPKNLPKTHSCWTIYYTVLGQISAASGIDLSSLKNGDYNGNPYMFDENETENGINNSSTCQPDTMIYYNGDGTAARTVWKEIPNSVTGC